MVVVALIAAGCVSSAPESASHTIAPEPTSNTIKTDGLYRAKTDAPICETHESFAVSLREQFDTLVNYSQLRRVPGIGSSNA